MRTQITSVAAAMLLLAGSAPEVAEARKHLVDVNEERRVERYSDPVVGTDTCKDYCVFGKDVTEKVYWCFQFAEPLVTFGWEYKQDANTAPESTPIKHLRWDMIWYLQNQFKITSIMDIYRLFYGNMKFEVPRIDLKLDIGMIVNDKWQWCPHVAYNRSAITMLWTSRIE